MIPAPAFRRLNAPADLFTRYSPYYLGEHSNAICVRTGAEIVSSKRGMSADLLKLRARQTASSTRAFAVYPSTRQALTTSILIQLIGTSIAVATLVRAVLGMIPLLDNDPLHRFAALRFGQEGWKSIRKLLLGGFLQGYVWAW